MFPPAIGRPPLPSLTSSSSFFMAMVSSSFSCPGSMKSEGIRNSSRARNSSRLFWRGVPDQGAERRVWREGHGANGTGYTCWGARHGQNCKGMEQEGLTGQKDAVFTALAKLPQLARADAAPVLQRMCLVSDEVRPLPPDGHRRG